MTKCTCRPEQLHQVGCDCEAQAEREYREAQANRCGGADELPFDPTSDQIDTFRAVEEEACFGNPMHISEMRPDNQKAARELAALGFLREDDGDFYITEEGCMAFCDVGR